MAKRKQGGMLVTVRCDNLNPADLARLLRKVADEVEAVGLATGPNAASGWDDEHTFHVKRETFRDRFTRRGDAES